MFEKPNNYIPLHKIILLFSNNFYYEGYKNINEKKVIVSLIRIPERVISTFFIVKHYFKSINLLFK